MGHHILVDLYGCPAEKLEKLDVVKKLLWNVVKESDFNALGDSWHQFQPFGVTGIILLAESHISIHTWPENNSAAVDIFSCSGTEKAEKAFKTLLKMFTPKKHVVKEVQR